MHFLKNLWRWWLCRPHAAENHQRSIVPCQTSRFTNNNLPVRRGDQLPGVENDDTPDMFTGAPPELIRCILEGGIVSCRGRSFEDVVAELKRDPSILGATFTVDDGCGGRGRLAVWRNGENNELANTKKPELTRNTVRRIGR